MCQLYHIRRLLHSNQPYLPQLWNSHSRGQLLFFSLHLSNSTGGKLENRTILCSLVDCIHLSFNCGTKCFHGNVHLIQTKWTMSADFRTAMSSLGNHFTKDINTSQYIHAYKYVTLPTPPLLTRQAWSPSQSKA